MSVFMQRLHKIIILTLLILSPAAWATTEIPSCPNLTSKNHIPLEGHYAGGQCWSDFGYQDFEACKTRMRSDFTRSSLEVDTQRQTECQGKHGRLCALGGTPSEATEHLSQMDHWTISLHKEYNCILQYEVWSCYNNQDEDRNLIVFVDFDTYHLQMNVNGQTFLTMHNLTVQTDQSATMETSKYGAVDLNNGHMVHLVIQGARNDETQHGLLRYMIDGKGFEESMTCRRNQ